MKNTDHKCFKMIMSAQKSIKMLHKYEHVLSTERIPSAQLPILCEHIKEDCL